jgi:hypothetical protein
LVGGALAEILTRQPAGAAWQHHVGHDEVDFPGESFPLPLGPEVRLQRHSPLLLCSSLSNRMPA